MADEKHLVDPEHLLSALRRKYSRDDITLVDYQVSRATANVLGITSVILRVKIFAKFESGEQFSDSLVVKRLPLCQAQLNLVNTCSSFEREIEYFTEFVPILERKIKSNLAFAECYFGKDRVLVMEDLCANGYQSLVSSIGDLRFDLITLKRAEAVFKELAKIHAASLDFDWLGNFPKYLNDDPLFDNDGEVIFIKQLASAIDGFIFLLDENVKENHVEVINWLKTDGLMYKTIRKYTKSNEFAVLNHGDPWANNILFREADGNCQLKLVDLQLGRFAPGACDLTYFLYTSTNPKFRQQHEDELIKFYLEQFNSFAGICSVGTKYKFEVYWMHYNKLKLYGLMFAILCRPMLYMHKSTPSQEMSDEKFNEFIVRDYSAVAVNDSLKAEVVDIFSEIVLYHKNVK
jgi:hypothetical protein